MAHGARLSSQRTEKLLASWPSTLVLRPWFDWLAIRLVTRWYFPVSRAWATGLAAGGSRDQFYAALGIEVGDLRNVKSILETLTLAQRRYQMAAAIWEDRFFGRSGVTDERLVEVEADRFGASTDLMSLRRRFLPLRNAVSQANWAVASPADVKQAHGLRLQSDALAFPAPSSVPVERSRPVPGRKGEEFWIRMPSPVPALGDTAWAHVFMPRERPVKGVIVSLHGVVMEPEMWPLADMSDGLLERGFCVIRPEAPWHGRRRLTGYFGGEPIFARGVMGFIQLFEASVTESALWIQWAREAVHPRVAIGGVSLGALTSQMVVSACRHWPKEMRPDGARLVTTTCDTVNGALQGSLASCLGMAGRLTDAGWNENELDRWRSLLEPGDSPSIDAGRIVMVLGDADTVTPFEGGMILAQRWNISPENLFVRHQGHFSTALGLYRNSAPLDRAADIFAA